MPRMVPSSSTVELECEEDVTTLLFVAREKLEGLMMEENLEDWPKCIVTWLMRAKA